MAYQYVTSFTYGNNQYAIQYHTEIRAFNVIVSGPDTPITEVPDDLLWYPETFVFATFCEGTTGHAIHPNMAYPFATVEIVANHPECTLAPPPDPPPPNPTPLPETELYYGLIYRATFTNVEGTDIEMQICDSKTLVADPVDTAYIELEPSGDPLHISVIDNDESKFTPIRAKQATMQFLSTEMLNINTFADGEDNRWKVFLKARGHTFFTGFLVIDDLDEDFNFHPNAVTLTATDGLGLLKDIPLTDFTGKTPKSYQKIIHFLSWALAKTGLSLNINLMDNLYENTYAILPAFDNIYLHSKTFEGKEIGECEDCYSVLQKIFKDEYFLTQWGSEWWICRVNEYEDRGNYYFAFDHTGTYIEGRDIDLTRVIKQPPPGIDDGSIEHTENETYINLQRKRKHVAQIYNYEIPREIIDNIDFSRGQWLSPLVVPNKTVEGNEWQGSGYAVDDWTFVSNTTGSGTANIIRYSFDGYERERYVRIRKIANAYQYIRSNRIPVSFKDKFSISVDRRFDVDFSGSGFYRHAPMQVRLYGEDGTFWTLHGGTSVEEQPKWVPSDANFNTNNSYVVVEGDLSEDLREWKTTMGGEAPPVPVSGELEVILLYNLTNGSEIHFSNLRFDYKPYINGSYQEFNGHHHKVWTTENFKTVREEQVYISDMVKPLFKGGMFKKVGDKYVPAERWFNGNEIPFPSAGNLYSRGKLQAYSVWNQHNRTFRILDSHLQGMETDGDLVANGLPDVVHRWTMGDPSPHTDKRYFLLLHYNMDYYLCEWDGYFIEVYHRDIDKEYGNPYEFKYLTNGQAGTR